MAFGVWDYVVFILMLVISAGIGVFVRFSGGRQKTTEVGESALFFFILHFLYNTSLRFHRNTY